MEQIDKVKEANQGPICELKAGDYAIIEEGNGCVNIWCGSIKMRHDNLHIIDEITLIDGEIIIRARRINKVKIDFKFTESVGKYVGSKGTEYDFDRFVSILFDPEVDVQVNDKKTFLQWISRRPATPFRYICREAHWMEFVTVVPKVEYWNKREYKSNNYVIVKY